MNKIIETIGLPAAYEQLAEECTELAKAALKMARAMRLENPTPVTRIEADMMITEELSDVAVACEALGLEPDPEIMKLKQQRWLMRCEYVTTRRKELQ